MLASVARLALVVCMVGAGGGGALGQPGPLSVDDPASSESSPSTAAERMSALAERISGMDREAAVEASSARREVVVSEIESTPLGQAPERRAQRLGGAGLPGAASSEDSSGGDAERWSGSGLLPTLGALGVVIGLIFLVRFGLAKLSGTPLVASSSAVEVLSRTSVAPRSHVLLLRVGPRVLVVGESSGGLRTLSEVEDEQEVALMLQAVETAKPQSVAGGFSSLMGKLNKQYADADGQGEGPAVGSLVAPPIDRFEAGLDESEAPVDRARDSLSSLAGRLRLRSGGLDGKA